MPINWITSNLRARRIARKVRRTGRASAENLPVIYLPGILGVKLYDRKNKTHIWGDYRGTLFHDPQHAGYALRNDDSVIADEHMHYFKIIPGLLDSLITAELKQVLEQALSYKEGRDLFFLCYDWRRDFKFLSKRIEQKIRDIRKEYGPTQQVIILGQSAANLAVRHLLRTCEPTIRDSIAKWYAFGPPWKGTYNSLKMLREGYYPAGRLFHGFSPEDSFTYPGCYQLLPRNARICSLNGETIDDFDIYNADCWADYGLGPASLKNAWSAMRPVLQNYLDRSKALERQIEGTDPKEARVSQTWFVGTRNQAVTSAVAHPGGALVSEAAIRKYAPDRATQCLAQGDDHIPLSHLTQNPCGPLIHSCDSIPYGESYVLMGKPHDHRAIINYQPNLRALAMDIGEVNTRS